MAEFREAPFGHEPPGVATRKVIGVVLTLGAVVAIALVALWLALTYWVMPEHARLKTRPAVLPPAPRLQPHPDNDLTALREEKRALLDGYLWTDKTHRFARIPIERAMQIYVGEQERKPGPGGNAGLGTRGPEQKPGPGTRDRGPGTAVPAASASSGRQP
ncbi:MAG TPA: hypothetical protein VJ862_09510 [Rhodanobacteraceae bacterium]|nr:hypothetical protein [Rhodanobacteraceae bacterium]